MKCLVQGTPMHVVIDWIFQSLSADLESVCKGEITQLSHYFKKQPEGQVTRFGDIFGIETEHGISVVELPCAIGEVVGIREDWGYKEPADYKRGVTDEINEFFYESDYKDMSWSERRKKLGRVIWCEAMHMPDNNIRTFLRIVDMDVKRVQDLNESDALAGGIKRCENPDGYYFGKKIKTIYYDPLMAMKDFWDSRLTKAQLKKFGWELNPWVFVYKFEVVEDVKHLD